MVVRDWLVPQPCDARGAPSAAGAPGADKRIKWTTESSAERRRRAERTPGADRPVSGLMSARAESPPEGIKSMAEPRDRIRREQLRHGVASVVRDLILSRKVRPGDTLRLGPIAEQLDISVTPVREALLLLAQDGWLAQEPNRGFLVLPTRRSDVEDIYLMWGVAEGAQAARAATQVTEADVETLRKIDSDLHNTNGQTPQRALELNSELHDTIRRVADAPKLQWFTDAARRLVPYEFWFEFHHVPGWRELNSTDHTAIIDAIEAHDADEAGGLMKEHYDSTSVLLLRWLDSISFWDPEKDSSGSQGEHQTRARP